MIYLPSTAHAVEGRFHYACNLPLRGNMRRTRALDASSLYCSSLFPDRDDNRETRLSIRSVLRVTRPVASGDSYQQVPAQIQKHQIELNKLRSGKQKNSCSHSRTSLLFSSL